MRYSTSLPEVVRGLVQSGQTGHFVLYPSEFRLNKFPESSLSLAEQEVFSSSDISNVDLNQSDSTIFEFTILDSVCDAAYHPEHYKLDEALSASNIPYRTLWYSKDKDYIGNYYSEVLSYMDGAFTYDTVIVQFEHNFDTNELKKLASNLGYDVCTERIIIKKNDHLHYYAILRKKGNIVSDSFDYKAASLFNFLQLEDGVVDVLKPYSASISEYQDVFTDYSKYITSDTIVAITEYPLNDFSLQTELDLSGYQTTIEGKLGSNYIYIFNSMSTIVDSQKVSDSSVSSLIGKDEIYDLWSVGKIEVTIPEDTDPTEFAEEAIDWIQSIWGDPEVGITQYDPIDIAYSVQGDTILFYVV